MMFEQIRNGGYDRRGLAEDDQLRDASHNRTWLGQPSVRAAQDAFTLAELIEEVREQ
jgi:hypothetical protein